MVTPMVRLPCATVVVLACALFTARAAAQSLPAPASCATSSQNLYVRDVMKDIYLWYREIPEVDPAAFDSPEAYLEAIRYRPVDSSFSYIASRAATDAFYSDSQYIGFGFTPVFVPPGELQVSEVMPGSPARDANLTRGDRIVEINGRSVEAIVGAGELSAALGAAENGISAEVVVLRGTQRFRAHMTKRLVTIPTVSATRVIQADGRSVGYVFFRNFVEPSFDALDAAFGELRNRGVDELILDLRYNGGGLVTVAQHLASLIGGTRTEGGVFTQFTHNDRHAERNRVLSFQAKVHALSLGRVVVIATRASASASELVMNALRPFMPVIVIGERTYGKPVGQYNFGFCDRTLAPVAFSLRNAMGQGDYFEGIAPTCMAADDLAHQIGDPLEASLREALTFIATGRCSGRASAAATAPAARRDDRARATGWQALINAH
jgi:C-terminal peptidase prc